MVATAVLVTALSSASDRLGPLLGGILTALPVLASVLAVFTHREDGAAAAIDLLRGMLAGMAGFVAFCELVSLLIVRVDMWPTFAVATAAAVMLQGVSAVRGPAKVAGARS
jgi:hypothetical protein